MSRNKLKDLSKRYGKWLRMNELPFSRKLADTLIREGLLFSVQVGTPGSKRGVRLVLAQSLDDYLNSLAVKPEKEVGV